MQPYLLYKMLEAPWLRECLSGGSKSGLKPELSELLRLLLKALIDRRSPQSLDPAATAESWFYEHTLRQRQEGRRCLAGRDVGLY